MLICGNSKLKIAMNNKKFGIFIKIILDLYKKQISGMSEQILQIKDGGSKIKKLKVVIV